MKNILIIKAGSTFPSTKSAFGDFDDWIIDHSGESPSMPVVKIGRRKLPSILAGKSFVDKIKGMFISRVGRKGSRIQVFVF